MRRVLGLAAGLLLATAAHAQQFPTKPVKKSLDDPEYLKTLAQRAGLLAK